jgi:phosphoglycolate phosphatase-like HAD superfamily hydrolase
MPLIVDLDGTLVACNTLHRSLFRAVLRKPLRIPALGMALLRGKAAFKEAAALHGRLDPASLPYRLRLLAYLDERRRSGAPLWLATGADRTTASDVARHLGIFSGVLASDGKFNCVGESKLQLIRSAIGNVDFEYIGDSWADLPIFQAAALCHLAHPPKGLLEVAKRTLPLGKVFD